MEDSGDGAEWVIENMVAKGAVTDFSGKAKHAGKTTFWCCGIAAVSAGETHAGFETEAGTRFLYLTEQGNNFSEAVEDSGLMDHPGSVQIVQFHDVAGAEWGQLIDDAAKDAVTMGAGVLVIDTFSAFAGLVEGDENLAGPVGERMRVLRLAAQKHGIAVVLIRHTGKDGTPRGSSAFEAEADICVVLQKPEGNHDPRVRKLSAVGRYGAWERNVQFVDGRFGSLGGDDRIRFNEAVRFIRATLPETPGGGMKKKDLLELGGDEKIAATTLARALEFLAKQGTVGERQLMNERGQPKVYWLAQRSSDPDPPPGGEKEEHPVGKGKEVCLNQTPPPTSRGGANKPEQTQTGPGEALAALLDDLPDALGKHASIAAQDPARHAPAFTVAIADALGEPGREAALRPRVLAWLEDRRNHHREES